VFLGWMVDGWLDGGLVWCAGWVVARPRPSLGVPQTVGCARAVAAGGDVSPIIPNRTCRHDRVTSSIELILWGHFEGRFWRWACRCVCERLRLMHNIYFTSKNLSLSLTFSLSFSNSL
jgi:hypothetical protein